ncbi:MAG: tRNA lysidine(34) synthetase TilS [Anaerolineales bacterium]|nr:tRNA lysidine(34) synthetase TilS [Anaerolineales bacterium]
MDTLKQVETVIREFDLLKPGQKVVAGVSGGADSLCLMACLVQLGYTVIVAHFDHQLRPESGEEANYVKKVTSKFGLHTVVKEGDVQELIKNGHSMEEAARIARYTFMAEVARDYDADTLATGHTADDQIETILMHFLRGSGPSGLRGMLPVTDMGDWVGVSGSEGIRLVRPLIELRRSQTESFCQRMGLIPVEDPSNLDLSILRNRIRHELVPLLLNYNPGLHSVLQRTGHVMAGEVALIQELILENWTDLVIHLGEHSLILDRHFFYSLPIALKRAMMRRVLTVLSPGIRDVGYDIVEQMTLFLSEEASSGHMQLLAGMAVERYQDIAVVFKEGETVEFPQYPQMEVENRIPVKLPFRHPLESGWMIQGEKKNHTSALADKLNAGLKKGEAAFDLEQLKNEFAIRTPVPGDRFRPMGLGGTMKLSDFFINLRIPRLARENWPLVEARGEILWVVGLRTAHSHMVGKDSEEIAWFELFPPKDEKE